jgi:hypothetical protein
MAKDRLSVPPAGIVRGVFAPEMLNPEVVALTELMVQEKKRPLLVIVKVSESRPPPLTVNPVNVCPFTPQALSLEVTLMAVTVTVLPLRPGETPETRT